MRGCKLSECSRCPTHFTVGATRTISGLAGFRLGSSWILVAGSAHYYYPNSKQMPRKYARRCFGEDNASQRCPLGTNWATIQWYGKREACPFCPTFVVPTEGGQKGCQQVLAWIIHYPLVPRGMSLTCLYLTAVYEQVRKVAKAVLQGGHAHSEPSAGV